MRILTTLLEPTRGSARVAGFDVVADAAALRTMIGLAGQFAAVDEILTGYENLEMVGILYGLDRAEARRRAEAVLERFDLVEAADRLVRTYSGGMRRRLDLGASLVGRPRVLFLDEPTTGLDLRSRQALWEVIEQLVDDGTTVLLTTQYLEEADQLADRIAVIDHGTLIAEGTSEELKARVGGDVLELEVADPSRLLEAADVVAGLGSEPPTVDGFTHRVKLPISDPVGMIAQVVRDLDARSIGLRDLAIHRPTLDDVFLTLTGKPAVDETEEEPPLVEAAAGRRSRR